MKVTFDRLSPTGVTVSTGWWAHQTHDDPRVATLHCWCHETRRDGWVAFFGPGKRYRAWSRKAAAAKYFAAQAVVTP